MKNNEIRRRCCVALDMTRWGLLAAVAIIALAGCHVVGVRGNGNVTTENRPATDFVNVEAEGAFNLQWSSGPPAVNITTDQNLLRYIETSVSGQTLRIRSREPLRPTEGLKVKLSSSGLRGAKLTGAVRLTATRLIGKGFYLDATGATRVSADGTVNELLASMTGASRLDADLLQAQTVELSISGAGRADVSVTDTLKVSISGAGKVTYAGHPKTIKKDVSGAGSIKPRD